MSDRFTMFVSSQSPRAESAISIARRLDGLLAARGGGCAVVDVLSEPAAAAAERILATPALVRHGPATLRIVGEIEDFARLCVQLGLHSSVPAGELGA
jgi:hypothetical protein